jgi:hypothetical protein
MRVEGIAPGQYLSLRQFRRTPARLSVSLAASHQHTPREHWKTIFATLSFRLVKTCMGHHPLSGDSKMTDFSAVATLRRPDRRETGGAVFSHGFIPF